MKTMRINGVDLEEFVELCPLMNICKVDCTLWEKKNYVNCPNFRYNIGKPKVIAYIVERVVSKLHEA